MICQRTSRVASSPRLRVLASSHPLLLPRDLASSLLSLCPYATPLPYCSVHATHSLVAVLNLCQILVVLRFVVKVVLCQQLLLPTALCGDGITLQTTCSDCSPRCRMQLGVSVSCRRPLRRQSHLHRTHIHSWAPCGTRPAIACWHDERERQGMHAYPGNEST